MPLGKLFAVVKNISLRLLIVPFFGRYFWLKNKFAKKTSDPKEKIILIFTNRYIIHLIVVIITFGVTTSNILAYENSEDYGRGALIYNIVGVENYDMGDDDTTVASSKPQV
ncbi:MAG TPA: hypothetical protein VJB67_00455, partial [Patescibacteria group bacterium]|nr:hypothetical protein [Patescibacteria group bacterium]